MKIHDITPLVMGNTAKSLDTTIIRPFIMIPVQRQGLPDYAFYADTFVSPLEYSYHWLQYTQKQEITLPVGPLPHFQTPGDWMSLPTIRVGPYLIYQATATRLDDGDLGLATLPGGQGYLWTMVPKR